MEKEVKDFGSAIKALKDGYGLSRTQWGDGPIIYLNAGSSDVSKELEVRPEYFNGVPSSLFVKGDVGTLTRLPNINFKGVNGVIFMGWTPSQEDIFAEDWTVID